MARGVFMSRVKAKSEGAGSTEDLDKNDGLFHFLKNRPL